jgi:hypothetical protein
VSKECPKGWVPVFPEMIGYMRHAGMNSSQILAVMGLMFFRRDADGHVFVGTETLGDLLGHDQGYVVRLVRSLKKYGVEIVPGKQGRGHSNQYYLDRFLTTLVETAADYRKEKAGKRAAGALYRSGRRMEKLKLERDAARAAGKEGAEAEVLAAMEKLASNMDILSRAGRAFQPEDRIRLEELRKKREARETEATIPEPTVELILGLQPNFATEVRDWLTESATERVAPAMGDDDLLRLGVAVAKKNSPFPDSNYWMLAGMTADAIKKGDVVEYEASAQVLIMRLRTEGAGKAGSNTDSSCWEGGNLLDTKASATALRRE